MKRSKQTVDISLRYALEERPNPSLFCMHTHPEYEIYWFMSGKGTFHIEGTAYPLQAGDILIMRSNEAHYIAISPDVPYERCSLHFDPALVRKTRCGSALLDVFENRPAGQRNLFSAKDFPNDDAYMALSETKSNGDMEPTLALACLFPLLITLNAVKREKAQTEEGLVYQIVSYVNRHLEEELSLEAICKRFFLSKSKLCRIFKQEMGSTVWRYITVKRITTAHQLICEGRGPAEAATAVGFSEYSVFWRAYKKYYGTTPREN